MDEHTCRTCVYGEQSYNEYPCYVCDTHYSQWEQIDDDDDDDDDDFELIDGGFIGIE